MTTLAERLDAVAESFVFTHPHWKTASEASISITLAIQYIQKLLDSAPADTSRWPDNSRWIDDAKRQLQDLITVLEL